MRAVIALALICTAATGCLRVSRRISELPPGDWTQRLGNPRHAPFVDEHVPETVQVEWNEGMGRGVPVTAIVQNGLIISVVNGGGLVTASTRTGQRYWSRRFNGAIAGQALRAGNRVFFATQHRTGSVYALDLTGGRRIWNRRLGAAASAEAVLDGDRIYVATERGDVLALGTADGAVLWRVRTGSPARQPPIILGDALVLATRDTLLSLDRRDGSLRARHAIAGTPSAPIAVRGDTLIIAMHPGIVSAYAEAGARELWRHTLSAPVLAAPVVTDAGVYVLTREAELLRLGPYSARRIIDLDGTATESLTIAANGALIGTLDGRLVHVRLDGTFVWQEQLSGSVRAPAAVQNSEVYVGTLNGRIVKLKAG